MNNHTELERREGTGLQRRRPEFLRSGEERKRKPIRLKQNGEAKEKTTIYVGGGVGRGRRHSQLRLRPQIGRTTRSEIRG